MNGQSTVEVIKSCVPAIQNPWQMPSIDVDAVLIAIRIATYGEAMEVNANCPSCGHHNEYNLNLIHYIDGYQGFQYNSDLPVGELVVKIKPYSYKETTKIALKTLEQQKIFNIVNDEKITDEVKIEKFGESFVKLTALTVDVIADSIVEIEAPTGVVTDKQMIKEFINNAPKDVFNVISTHINSLKEQIDLKVEGAECEECHHKYDMPVSMDQTNFFAQGS
jgi:hypothetical protein